MTSRNVSINLDGHTLSGVPADLAAILAALPAPAAVRPTRATEQPTTPVVRRTRKTKAARRTKIVVPTMSDAAESYLRTLYAVGPEVPVGGRGALIAAHLLDGQAHTINELRTLLGVHHQTVVHTLIRLIQGGCQITVDGTPAARSGKMRFTGTAPIQVVNVGTVAQAKRALARYTTGKTKQVAGV